MKKLFIILLAISGGLNVAVALNLQPQEITVKKDGPPIRRYFFRDETKRVLFRIDNKMTVTGGSNQAVFQFSDIRNATMRISKSGMTPQVPFDEKNLELYRTAARGYIPAQATDIQFVEERADAIPINGWVNHQFVVNYKMFGAAYRQSITFINYSETEQLVLDVAALEADYEKAYARSYRVVNSLSDYVPNAETGPT